MTGRDSRGIFAGLGVGKRVASSGNEVPDSIDLRVHLEDLLRSRADSIMQSEGAAGHHFQHFDGRDVSPVT